MATMHRFRYMSQLTYMISLLQGLLDFCLLSFLCDKNTIWSHNSSKLNYLLLQINGFKNNFSFNEFRLNEIANVSLDLSQPSWKGAPVVWSKISIEKVCLKEMIIAIILTLIKLIVKWVRDIRLTSFMRRPNSDIKATLWPMSHINNRSKWFVIVVC